MPANCFRPWRALVASAAVLLAGAGGVLPAQAAYGPAELLFNFQDERIRESSGVSDSATPGVLFTHNDSGDYPRLFAVGTAGQTYAELHVAGVNNTDWEDMARGPGADAEPALFLADIGDNARTRVFTRVHEVKEPVVDTTFTGVTGSLTPTRSWRLIYEDGPRDAESLLVSPAGDIVVVSKEPTGLSGVYVASDELTWLVSDLLVLRRVATVDFRTLASPPRPGESPTGGWQTTGGDWSPDGTKVVVRTYQEAFEWMVGPGGLGDAFASPPSKIGLPQTQQGEAIAYAAGGSALVVTSEGEFAPVHKVASA